MIQGEAKGDTVIINQRRITFEEEATLTRTIYKVPRRKWRNNLNSVEKVGVTLAGASVHRGVSVVM
jgi:hypothetical protein